MKEEEMRIISEHLIDALNKEDLTTRDAAKALNLSPGYVSMAKNPKLWGSMSKDAWYRLTQWHNSRGKITEFKIPEDESIFMPKDQVKLDASKTANKTVKKTSKKSDTQPAPQIKPERNDSSVWIKKDDEKIDHNDSSKWIDAFISPDPPEAHLRVCLDLEITLTINGQKVKI